MELTKKTQQSIKEILAFLHIVLYIPNPKMIAAKIANGNTTKSLLFNPILNRYNLSL